MKLTKQNVPFYLGTVVAAVALTMLFEFLRPRDLSYDGLWAARLSLASVFLLAINLVVLWWYAQLTNDLAGTAQSQYRLAWTESQAQLAERIQANKPIVVTVREERGGGAFEYFVSNVGRGTAINVWYADIPRGQTSWRLQALGALDPGGRRRLIELLARPLCDSGGEFKHLLLAEGVPTRTTRWTVTANGRTTQAGGDMRHDLASLARADHDSIEDLMALEEATLRSQIAKLPVRAT